MMGGRSLRRQIVQLGAILPADVDHVFETGRSDQRGSHAFAFQQRVGGDRGSVNHFGALAAPPLAPVRPELRWPATADSSAA